MNEQKQVVVKYKDVERVYSIKNDMPYIQLTEQNFLPEKACLVTLTGHSKPQNILLFSHGGDYDADGREIFILTNTTI